MRATTIRNRQASRRHEEGVGWGRLLLPASALALVLTLALTLALTLMWAPGQARATEPAATGLAEAARNAETTETNSPAPVPSSSSSSSFSSGDPALTGEVLAGAELEPLPRFTVGWYCPAPNRNPGREALAFGLGVILIWAMAERKKARQASAQARDTVSH